MLKKYYEAEIWAWFQTKSYFSEFNFTEPDFLFYAFLISDDLR